MAAMEEDGAEHSNFDLEAYIANYSGHSKIERLMFIANNSAGRPLELEALKLAHNELRKGQNVVRYGEVCDKINGRLGEGYNYDRAWAEQVDRRAQQKQEKLEGELQNYKANMIKESIRMGHNDLGDHYYDRGDLQNAFKCYVRTRDYCSTAKHVLAMCMHVITISADLGNTMHMGNYIGKAEQTPQYQEDPVYVGKLRAATALVHLQQRKYKLAAQVFTSTPPDLGSSFNNVLAAQDVGMMGGLCALASFDRADLKTRVISNIGFKEFLELVPEMREVIHDFYNSRYASCLRRLDSLRPSLHLDMYLAEHVSALISQIRQRALIQYAAPFSSVNLHVMAEALNTDVGTLEKEVASLVMDGAVAARIDSHAKVLIARHADVRAATFQKALTVGEEALRDSKAAILRANLLQHDFLQKPRAQRAGMGGMLGGDDGGGGGGEGGGPSRRGGPPGRGGGGGGSSVYNPLSQLANAGMALFNVGGPGNAA